MDIYDIASYCFGRGERFYLGPLSEVSWLNIACNLLCIHGFFPYYINSVNVNWFIADLVIWYLIAPFVYKKFNSLQKMVSGLLIMIPVVYGLLIVLYKIPIISSEPIWKDYLFCLSFLPEFPVIFLGGIIFWLEKGERLKILSKRSIYSGLFFAIASMSLLIIGSDKFVLFSNIFSFSICLAIVFIAQLEAPIRFWDNRVFTMFGKYSYGIYLSHIFVISLVWKIMGDVLFGSSMLWQIIVYSVLCMSSLVVGMSIEKIYGTVKRLLVKQIKSKNDK